MGYIFLELLHSCVFGTVLAAGERRWQEIKSWATEATWIPARSLLLSQSGWVTIDSRNFTLLVGGFEHVHLYIFWE